MALWTTYHETLRLSSQIASIEEIVRFESGVPFVASQRVVDADVGEEGGGGGDLLVERRSKKFPDGMNYSSFLEWHHGANGDGANNRTSSSGNVTEDSPLLSYFPDFCEEW